MESILSAMENSRLAPISPDAIRSELDRIAESPIFVQSERLGRFLRYTVESTLEGKGETLKEYVIGTYVYGRGPSYQPTEDSIVRSEARRLRRKLQEFYETIGKDDLVFICYRPGSYVPVFRQRDGNSNSAPPSSPAFRNAAVKSLGVRVAVFPFVDVSGSALSGACAQFLTDDLIHELVRTIGVRVTTASGLEGVKTEDISSLAKKLDVQLVFEGTVGEHKNQLRVTSRVVNAGGVRIWSERFETDRHAQDLFRTSARIASTLISKFRRALLLLGLDNRDRAIPTLSAAYQQREAELIWLAHDPRLDAIREDSRFRSLPNGVVRDSPEQSL